MTKYLGRTGRHYQKGEIEMNEQDKELAIKCRLITSSIQGIYVDTLQKFADLIRADEREACAKVCDEYVGYGTRVEFAATIRARGNT